MTVLNPLLMDHDNDPPTEMEIEPSKDIRMYRHEQEQFLMDTKIHKMFHDRKSACKAKFRFCVSITLIVTALIVGMFCIFGFKPIPASDSDRTLQFLNDHEMDQKISRVRRILPTQQTYGLCRVNNFAYISNKYGADLKCKITKIESQKKSISQITKIHCIPIGKNAASIYAIAKVTKCERTTPQPKPGQQPSNTQQTQPQQRPEIPQQSQENACPEINRNEYRFARTAGVAVELKIGVELKFAETINNAGLVLHTGKVVSFNKDLQLITLRYTEQSIVKTILITFNHATSIQPQLILPSNLPQFITHDPLGQLRKGMEVYVTKVNNEKVVGNVQVLNQFCKTALILLNNPTNNAIFVVRSYAELKADNKEIEIGGLKSNDRQDDCAPAIVKCESPSEQTHSERKDSVDSAIDVCGDSDEEQPQQPQQLQEQQQQQQQQQQENTTPEYEDEEGEGEEEMVVPNPIDSSKYFNTIPNYGPGTPMNNILNEIHTDIYFVYALYLKDRDGNISTPFYIGVTDNPYVRYYFHLKINSDQLALKLFIQANKENIVMRVLYGGKMEECLFVETLYIKFNTQLQYDLMNIMSGSARTPPLFNCNPVNSLNDLIIYSIDNGNDVTPDNNKAPPTTILPFFTVTPDYPISFKNLMEEIVKMEHYLYILADIDEHGNIIKIIYVGITYLPELRLYNHFKYCKTSTRKYCIYIREHIDNMKMLVIHSNNRPMVSLFERCILQNKNSIKFTGLNFLNTFLYSTVTIPKCGNVNEWASSLLSHAILNSKRISKNEAISASPESLERVNTKRRQNGIGTLHRRRSSYADGDMDIIKNVWKNTQSLSAALATDLSKKTSLSTMELKVLFQDARAGKVSWLKPPSKLTSPTSNAGKPKCYWTEKNVKLMEQFFCKYIKSGKYTRLQVTTKKREMETTTGETALRISTWIKHRQSNAYNRQIKYC